MECPPDFYSNCSQAGVKCRDCAAIGRGKKLHYCPEEDIGQHPYIFLQELNKEKGKIQRKAKKTEKKVRDSIASLTLKSGSLNRDGDLALLNSSVRVEIKNRGKKSSFSLTYKEYEKGKRQGIEAYAINVVCPDNIERTMYFMDENMFCDILSSLKVQLEVLNPEENV